MKAKRRKNNTVPPELISTGTRGRRKPRRLPILYAKLI
jgi:hypothetical protein